MIVAAPLGGQSAPTIVAWDLGDPTHTAAVTWEVETASDGVVSCVSPTQTATAWRCEAAFSRTVAQSVRIRGTNGPSVGAWSALVPAPAVPAGQAPGVLTITWAGEVQGGGGAPMAIAATRLTNGQAGGSPFQTASITPGANRLVLVAAGIYSTPGGGNATLPTSVTGNGITYALIAGSSIYTPNASFGTKIVGLYRGMAASPSAGVITFTGMNGNYVAWEVDEVDGVNTGGSNGSAAVVQSAVNQTNGATSLTATLAAFADAGNGAFSTFYGWGDATSVTPGSGWTELFDGASLDEPSTEWRTDNDTTADWSFATDAGGMVAIEIAAAGGAPSAPFPPFARRTRFLTRQRHARILPPPGLPGFSRDPVTGLHLPALLMAPGARKAA